MSSQTECCCTSQKCRCKPNTWLRNLTQIWKDYCTWRHNKKAQCGNEEAKKRENNLCDGCTFHKQISMIYRLPEISPWSLTKVGEPTRELEVGEWNASDVQIFIALTGCIKLNQCVGWMKANGRVICSTSVQKAYNNLSSRQRGTVMNKYRCFLLLNNPCDVEEAKARAAAALAASEM